MPLSARRLSVFACLAQISVSAAALQPTAAHSAETPTFSVTVDSRTIDNFRIGSDQMRFGDLEFVGGLEMIGSSAHFGALSAIQVFGDQTRLLGVTDTGFWYAGTIRRDENGHPAGLSGVTMWEMAPSAEKWQYDAEGMAVEGKRVYASFERVHRIAEYDLQADGRPFLDHEWKPPVPLRELRENRGFEAISIAPESTPFPGAIVGVAEKSLDRNRNMMGFVRRPSGKSFEFSVRRIGEFDATDSAFLPGGDLVLLERRFNVTDGVGMRLRRIRSADIVKGAAVDGEIMLEADLLYQIDNMEGLSVTVDPDGTPRLTLVSDDNHSILQRNLLLEFRLIGEGKVQTPG